jgi:hypothetical protein
LSFQWNSLLSDRRLQPPSHRVNNLRVQQLSGSLRLSDGVVAEWRPETPLSAIDFQEKYLTAVFRFFGITDIRFRPMRRPPG